jgi:hypothetical protein
MQGTAASSICPTALRLNSTSCRHCQRNGSTAYLWQYLTQHGEWRQQAGHPLPAPRTVTDLPAVKCRHVPSS